MPRTNWDISQQSAVFYVVPEAMVKSDILPEVAASLGARELKIIRVSSDEGSPSFVVFQSFPEDTSHGVVGNDDALADAEHAIYNECTNPYEACEMYPYAARDKRGVLSSRDKPTVVAADSWLKYGEQIRAVANLRGFVRIALRHKWRRVSDWAYWYLDVTWVQSPTNDRWVKDGVNTSYGKGSLREPTPPGFGS